ncbi:transcriptional regulator [Cryobacterium sp. TMT2-10]|uniref:Transcriptional regulator n=1 Tax=Cryobacterium shii TaxID=1259235 RepID=A0AAQ2HFI9_9MICO|nr:MULTISPECIES: ATP-binding protein [Cryobacterium]TFC47257.1 transcriptional regulator [Cryobacterium shii]TFC85429.1 transcriptional regulator [Cryobacterium sp. TmT2-59]TFD13107.1 transcriptional regulator [Cryobacterium sp. TMT4-10]TFD16952.1 transcriptional regulator [Cryobacterium sp. TMT2-23]TFD37976.1 transcriptional regulator [Cryobacterium sp. TMT2-10]
MNDEISAALRAIHSGSAVADKRESVTLDFKRQDNSISDTSNNIADAVVCFANAGGGSVILGVRDRIEGPDAIEGTSLDALALRKRIREVTAPSLDAVVAEFEFEGKRLLEITVQEGLDVYVSRGKVPSRRFNDECIPMTTAEISRLHQERQGGDWSAQDTGRPVQDIDPDAILRVKALLRQLPDETRRAIADADTEFILATLGLITSNGTLTRTASILLCHSDTNPTVEVLVYQHRENMGGEVNAGRRWTGPLLTALVDVLGVIEARVQTTPINLASGQQIQIQDYPLEAVREAVANAVMHGDHRLNRPITIEHSDQSLEVRSPGPLVSGVTPSNILTHPTKPRFPLLADTMRGLGLAEKWGQGVDRMYREMIRSGKKAPTIEVFDGDDPETSVTFSGGSPNARVAKFFSTLPPGVQNDTNALVVVSMLTAKRTVTALEVAPMIQRDIGVTQAELQRLANGEAELIEPTPRTVTRSNPDYRLRASALAGLGSALGYQPRGRSDRDQKIIAHLHEYGSINNATIQRMFDLDVFNARNVIQDLVGREILVRTTKAKSGTAVRYGPGAKFPARVKGRKNTGLSREPATQLDLEIGED